MRHFLFDGICSAIITERAHFSQNSSEISNCRYWRQSIAIISTLALTLFWKFFEIFSFFINFHLKFRVRLLKSPNFAFYFFNYKSFKNDLIRTLLRSIECFIVDALRRLSPFYNGSNCRFLQHIFIVNSNYCVAKVLFSSICVYVSPGQWDVFYLVNARHHRRHRHICCGCRDHAATHANAFQLHFPQKVEL